MDRYYRVPQFPLYMVPKNVNIAKTEILIARFQEWLNNRAELFNILTIVILDQLSSKLDSNLQVYDLYHQQAYTECIPLFNEDKKSTQLGGILRNPATDKMESILDILP